MKVQPCHQVILDDRGGQHQGGKRDEETDIYNTCAGNDICHVGNSVCG